MQKSDVGVFRTYVTVPSEEPLPGFPQEGSVNETRFCNKKAITEMEKHRSLCMITFKRNHALLQGKTAERREQ